ncbi:hypothetical protein C8R48DRAFT_722647 [Suillus tomentosus]|nr:hypothetical protein C8R48DRAFT_722647 [Suillus tomentosus]
MSKRMTTKCNQISLLLLQLTIFVYCQSFMYTMRSSSWPGAHVVAYRRYTRTNEIWNTTRRMRRAYHFTQWEKNIEDSGRCVIDLKGPPG